MTTRPRHISFLLLFIGIVLPLWAGAFSDSSKPLEAARKAEKAGDLSSAISNYSILLRGYDEDLPKEDIRKYAETFKHAGDICDDSQRYIEALEFYTKGYQAARAADDKEMMMRCLGNIGNVYAHFEDYKRARAYFDRVYRLALETDSRPNQVKVLINITTAAALAGETEEAKESFRKLKLVDPGSDPVLRYHTQRLQGLIAAAEGNPSGALYYHRLACNTIRQENIDSTQLAHELLNIGRTFMELHQNDSAQAAFNRSLEISTKINNGEALMSNYAYLAQLARQRGDSIGDMRYSSLSKHMADSLFNRREFNNARNKLVEYEEMLQTTQINDLNNRLVIQWVIIGFVALVLIIVGIAWSIVRRRNKELKYANEALLDKNHELIASEEKARRLMEKYLDSRPQEPTAENAAPVGNENNTTPAATEAASADAPCCHDADQQDPGQDATRAATPYLSVEQVEILLRRINRVLDDPAFIFNPDFSLNMLAKEVRSNTKYVSWVINDSYERNFKTLLNERRIREASKRLEDREHYGSLTIQAIASEVGYRSSTSFIHSFKKIVGMTPAVYQKLAYSKSDDSADLPGPESK